MSPLTVVFVCTGNTCRSPLAMAIARSIWPVDVTFLSAGLHATQGQPASDAAMIIADEHHLVLVDHRSRTLDNALLDRADWLIGMTRAHVALLKTRLSKISLGKTDTLRIGLLGHANQDLSDCPIPEAEDVPDPYEGNLDVYRATADQIARLLQSWVPTFTGETKGKT